MGKKSHYLGCIDQNLSQASSFCVKWQIASSCTEWPWTDSSAPAKPANCAVGGGAQRTTSRRLRVKSITTCAPSLTAVEGGRKKPVKAGVVSGSVGVLTGLQSYRSPVSFYSPWKNKDQAVSVAVKPCLHFYSLSFHQWLISPCCSTSNFLPPIMPFFAPFQSRRKIRTVKTPKEEGILFRRVGTKCEWMSKVSCFLHRNSHTRLQGKWVLGNISFSTFPAAAGK